MLGRLTGDHRDAIERVVRQLFNTLTLITLLMFRAWQWMRLWIHFGTSSRPSVVTFQQAISKQSECNIGEVIHMAQQVLKATHKGLRQNRMSGSFSQSRDWTIWEELGWDEGDQVWEPWLDFSWSTAIRALAYNTALVTGARMKCLADERIDASGASEILCDDDMVMLQCCHVSNIKWWTNSFELFVVWIWSWRIGA